MLSHYPALPAPLRVRLTTLPEQPCPYLPERVSCSRALLAREMDPEIYQDFMDAGFRRSGQLIYQPVCRGCRECVPLRVLVERFQPSKSQRRCLRRNEDVTVEIAEPTFDSESFELYQHYVQHWHERAVAPTQEEYEEFLIHSPVQTLQFLYRDSSQRLLAVGICDISSRSLSSVYFFFDPSEERRRLGVFGALHELRFAQAQGLAYYYLGYWVQSCRKMGYKCNYRPYQVLCGDGVWRGADDAGSGVESSVADDVI